PIAHQYPLWTRRFIAAFATKWTPIAQTRWVNLINRPVAHKTIQIQFGLLMPTLFLYLQSQEANFMDRIPIQPPLQIWIIEAVAVVIHPAVDVNLLARKPIDVSAGKCAARRDCVAKRVVPVT